MTSYNTSSAEKSDVKKLELEINVVSNGRQTNLFGKQKSPHLVLNGRQPHFF